MTAVTDVANALLNTLWQAAALTFLAWLGMRLAKPRLNAATRHIVWWIALAAIFFLASIPRSVRSAPALEPAHPPAVTSARVRVAPAPPLPQVEPLVMVTETGRAVWPFLLAAVWALFGARRITQAIRSYYRLRGVKRRAMVWDRPLGGLRRAAQVLISPEVSSPVAVGFLHPAVLLPADLREHLSGPEMDCILLHESAHLARYDDWQNLIAQLVAAVAGLHPVAWWILRQIEREREMACDDWVVAHTGAALAYADSLMRLVERRLAPESSVLAAGIFTQQSRLRARIEMLVTRGREFTTTAARIPVGVAGIVLAGLVLAGALAPNWIAFAQRPEFEVASVKHGDPKFIGSTWQGGPGTSDPTSFHAENTTMLVLAMRGYGAKYRHEIEWKSPWMAAELYDVAAKVPAGATKEQFAVMLQQLLEQRFGLVVHRETRQMAGYRLVVSEKGAKLKQASEAAPAASSSPAVVVKNGRPQFSDSAPSGILMTLSGAVLRGRHERMSGLVQRLIGEFQAPISDETGLEGEYDYDVAYAHERKPLSGGMVGRSPLGVSPASTEPVSTPDASTPDTLPTLRNALQAELGLKLEPVKSVTVEVLVLDKANREPTAN